MISKVSIRNFKSLRDVEIDLERFTVFVGPNASGKSSMLQGLDFLCRAFQLQGGSVHGELLNAVSRGAAEAVELLAQSDRKGYRVRIGPPSSPQSLGPFVRNHGQWDGQGCGITANVDAPDWKPWPTRPGTPSPLPQSILLRLESSKLVLSTHASPDPTVM